MALLVLFDNSIEIFTVGLALIDKKSYRRQQEGG
jgi:hypothetical protein